MARARRIVALLLTLGLAATASGCSDAEAPASQNVVWTKASLPRGFEPSLITPGPEGNLLIASDGTADGRLRPRLALLENGGFVPVPVKPTTTYGALAAWRGITVRGETIYAFGGRSGGAHGNIRWTAWTGSANGLVEEPQDFETFGGPDAGGLVGIVDPASRRPVVIGSRVSPTHDGLDIAVWDHVGHRWIRRSSAGTPLAASGDRQPSAHGATERGVGVLILGGETEFSPGQPRTVPALWTSSIHRGPFARVDLPRGTAALAEAQSATCDTDSSCLVVGYAEHHLAAWTLSAQGKVSSVDLPDVPVGLNQSVLAPVGKEGSWAIVVSGPSGGASEVLLQDGDGWRRSDGPVGIVTGFALVDHTMWLATKGKTGSSLWSARR